MRPAVDEGRIRELARRLGRVAMEPTRVYLTGGATYSQALSKIERGFGQDLDDVAKMLEHRLVEPARLRELYDMIEPDLYRYPAIEPGAFRRKVAAALP